ncbi:MAG: PEGA domain-containing protein, partial [Candidatus Methanoperedens sp.]|nr:PEGA domain-containing protein [Candidatus Methanoperedens sp.]
MAFYCSTIDKTGKMKIFRDGKILSNTDGLPVKNTVRTKNYVARSNWLEDSYFKGIIDEVRIYNRALSAEEVKASYEAGQITITSTISGAEVLLDGISRGKATPSLILDGISPGSHTVKCRLSGYADSETTVNLATSSTASVTCSLSQAPGSISVTSSPSGAEVYLDGALKGTAPVMLKDVSPGKHVIWCKKSGFEDFQL